MKLRHLFLLPAIFCVSTYAAAANDVMPPPQATSSEVTDVAKQPADIMESEPNLHEELNAPQDGVAVDVRSYQRKDGATITEYAVKGRVYKIKVQPSGDLPAYYLYDRDGDGAFEQRLPGGSKRISPPTWVLKEF